MSKQKIIFSWMMDNGKGTPENSVSKTNWQICAICQEATSEALQCPADTKHSDVGAGYKTLAGNLEKFYKLGCMPTDLSLPQIDEGNGIEGTLIMGKANPNALRRWMLSGPEMARLVNEFEAGMVPDTGTKENSQHHEEHRSFQVTFFKAMKSLVAAVEDLENPLLEETGDLFTLDTKVIAEQSAVSRMRHIESLQKEQCVLMNFLGMRTRAARRRYQIMEIYAFQTRSQS